MRYSYLRFGLLYLIQLLHVMKTLVFLAAIWAIQGTDFFFMLPFSVVFLSILQTLLQHRKVTMWHFYS